MKPIILLRYSAALRSDKSLINVLAKRYSPVS